MTYNNEPFRDRAVIALARLLGGTAQPMRLRLPASVQLSPSNVVVAAGDNAVPLDPAALRRAAHDTKLDAIGTYVDPLKAGHRLYYDLFRHSRGKLVHHDAYRLWLSIAEVPFFVPENGQARAVRITSEGMKLHAKPFGNEVERVEGLARGQALMTDLIWNGTPYNRDASGRAAEQR